MSIQEPLHRLRFSIDIKSIKDNDFIGQVFVKFAPIADLGITKQFRTNPLLQLSTPKVQEIFLNGFSSYYINTTGSALNGLFDKMIDIELYHSDRMKKDILIGIVKLEVGQLLDCPVRKAKNGYTRVFDAYLPVDEVNQSGVIVKKVAALRVLMYLEDLGPVSSLKEKEEELGLREPLVYERDVAPPMLPSQNYQNTAQDRVRQIELNQLEYKVVWQLETWRKAEEAKTKIHLKQKEVEYLAELADEQRKYNLEKEKQFKKIQGNLILKQKKLQQKIVELQKRQQKLVLLEQQMQNKATQMSRYCLSKDQIVSKMETKQKEDKTNWLRQKGGLDSQINALKAQNTKLRMQLQQAYKQDDKSPINIIRNQLNNRITDSKILMKSLEDANQVKKLYEQSYEKMRNQVIFLKKEMEVKKSKIETMMTENEVLRSKQKVLQQQLNLMNQNLRAQTQNNNQMPAQYQTHSQNYNNGYQYESQNQQQPVFSNKIERLKYQRQQYLNSGVYNVNDPFIKEYDKLIAEGY